MRETAKDIINSDLVERVAQLEKHEENHVISWGRLTEEFRSIKSDYNIHCDAILCLEDKVKKIEPLCCPITMNAMTLKVDEHSEKIDKIERSQAKDHENIGLIDETYDDSFDKLTEILAEHELKRMASFNNLLERIEKLETKEMSILNVSSLWERMSSLEKTPMIAVDYVESLEERIKRLEEKLEMSRDTIACVDRAYDEVAINHDKRLSKIESFFENSSRESFEDALARIEVLEKTEMHQREMLFSLRNTNDRLSNLETNKYCSRCGKDK